MRKLTATAADKLLEAVTQCSARYGLLGNPHFLRPSNEELACAMQ